MLLCVCARLSGFFCVNVCSFLTVYVCVLVRRKRRRTVESFLTKHKGPTVLGEEWLLGTRLRLCVTPLKCSSRGG